MTAEQELRAALERAEYALCVAHGIQPQTTYQCGALTTIDMIRGALNKAQS